MILQKIQQIRSVMQRTDEVSLEVGKRRAVNEFLSDCKNQQGQIQQIVGQFRVLHNAYPDRFVKLDLTRSLQHLNQMVTSVGQDTKKGQLTPLVRELESKEEQWKIVWKQYAEERAGRTIKLLETVKNLKGRGQDIMSLSAELSKLAHKWPISSSELQRFEGVLAEASEKVEGLKLNATVQQFLDKVAEQKATLADLTPEIINWLQGQDAAKNFSIQFKRG